MGSSHNRPYSWEVMANFYGAPIRSTGRCVPCFFGCLNRIMRNLSCRTQKWKTAEAIVQQSPMNHHHLSPNMHQLIPFFTQLQHFLVDPLTPFSSPRQKNTHEPTDLVALHPIKIHESFPPPISSCTFYVLRCAQYKVSLRGDDKH